MIASSKALRGLASDLASGEGVAVEDGVGAVEGGGLEGGRIDKVGLVGGVDVLELVGLEGVSVGGVGAVEAIATVEGVSVVDADESEG